MAILLSAHQITQAFGARPLFEGISFSIESGDRIGLIGPNGAGKSTLLRLIAGMTEPDSGTVSRSRGLKVGYLEQVPRFEPGATVEQALQAMTDSWEEAALVEEIVSKLSLKDHGTSTPVSTLSGGWQKRVAIGRELLKKPDLLLLDEPTNHLDVEGILWLEELLAESRFATLTITHDRVFLQNVARRILELDRRNPEGLLAVKGDFATFLETKEAKLNAQAEQEVRLRNTLRRETEWLRRGAKARTTKQQARIQRHGELEEAVGELAYRNKENKLRIEFQSAEKNPKKLIEAKGISKSYEGRKIIPELDLLVTPSSRIGLLGANGSGKSTLIRLLVGEEKSETGTVTHSEHLRVAYFEQNRETLDPDLSLLKTLCPTGDHVDYRGRRIHIRSYLERFLFDPGQAEMAVGKLSGGEQSRLLIARLMLKEANVLVMDEPTNDLDLATLQVLEDVLSDFAGAVILVTHDRFFLDQVATQILAIDPDEILSFEGTAQWEAHRLQKNAGGESKSGASKQSSGAGVSQQPAKKKRKLSYKEQRELDGMEETIQRTEGELARLTAQSLKPEFVSNAPKLAELTELMAKTQSEIDRLYARWAELERE